MHVVKNIEQIDLDRIGKNVEINKTLKDQRVIHYGSYLDSVLIGYILALNISDFLLITYIYIEECHRRKGVGHNLLLKLKQKGKIIKKRLCLKLYDIPNKDSIISFFASEGFSVPKVVRRNGIIHMKLMKELFCEKREFNTQEWLKSINGEIKSINLHNKSNDEIKILEKVKQIYDYTYLNVSDTLDIVVTVLINEDLACWIIYHEIAPKIMHVEFLYTAPAYRKHSIGFNSFTFFLLELIDKYDFEYLSFTTVKEDDKLLGYYKYLFRESLVKVIDTEISIYPNDEEATICTSIG